MSELRVAGVRLDTLLAMEPGSVINAVPEEQRRYYRYWRGLHLGKIALNIMQGRMVINAGETDNLIHFSENYDDAPRIAGNTARRPFGSQWSKADAARFAEFTGEPAPTYFGAAVIAAQYVGNWSTSKYDLGWGNSVNNPVGFHEIDPYSLQALENLFGVDLLRDTEPGLNFSHLPPTMHVIADPAKKSYADYTFKPGQRPLHI